MKFTGSQNYIATDDLKLAVNAAVTLKRPLLVKGEPGTGKTMTAKAMAAEAGVPFLFVSATSFQSMYYGATAKKIRSYFAALRKAARAEGGAIGFIGLVLPHAVSVVTGPAHRRLLPVAALAGATFLIWADTAARTVFDPRELPIGIITALVGVPVFAVLLRRGRGAAWS